MKFLSIFSPIASLLLPLSFIISSCEKSASFINKEGEVWNTFYHITYKGSPLLADSVDVVLEQVGRSLSVFDSTSVVSRVNAGNEIEVDEDFIRVYNAARTINERSEGMYDPTVSPLVTAWGFGPGHEPTSDTARIDSLLQFVGIGKTELLGNRLRKNDRRIAFNFSSIAKGYGCDKVAEMLRRNGVTDYMVEIGGEIACGGLGPSRRKWQIGIEKPVAGKEDLAEVIAVNEGGVASSGNYRNFHKEAGGKSFGHIISPLTGRPAPTDIAGCTVVAPDCMTADGYATAIMAMGWERARKVMSGLPYAVCIVRNDSAVWMNTKFRTLIVR